MKISRRRFNLLAAVMLAVPAMLGSRPVVAQTYPDQPIRLVVNFAAGGTSDVMARALSKPFSALLGQPLIVENKPGALGVVGTADVGRAKPDGYTLVLTTQGSLTESPVLSSNVPYDPLTDFEPVTLLGESPLILFAHPSFPADNVAELVEYGKSQADGVDLAVTGSSVKLGAYALSGSAGINLVQIPYGGQGPALTAALGGHTKLVLNTSSTALSENVKAGKLKILGVGSEQAYPLLPDVPPIADTLPGYTAKAWWGIFAPAGTDQKIIAKLNDAFAKAMQEPEVTAVFKANGVLPVTSSPKELGELVSTGLEQTRALVKEHDIPLE